MRYQVFVAAIEVILFVIFLFLNFFISNFIKYFLGTFSRRQGQPYMDLTFTNRAMQPMGGFAIQFNKNSFGLTPSVLQVPAPLLPNQSIEVSLQLGLGIKILAQKKV